MSSPTGSPMTASAVGAMSNMVASSKRPAGAERGTRGDEHACHVVRAGQLRPVGVRVEACLEAVVRDQHDVDVVAERVEQAAEKHVGVDVVVVDDASVGGDVLVGDASEGLGVRVLPEEVLDEVDAAQVHGRQRRAVSEVSVRVDIRE